jgi:WD40 repeat protein
MPKRRGHIQTQDEHVSSQLFAIHPTHKILFSCGHWDNTFKATAFESGRLLQSVSAHKDVVTCISLTVEVGKSWLVTGSRDCTLMIWEVLPRDLPLGNGTPIRTLYGHDDSVTSVSVNLELDVVVSGSNDGTIILHTLREGSYVRTILVGSPNYRILSSSSDPSPSASSSVLRSRIHWVCVTNEGYIVVYLNEEHLLHSYTINGRLLATKDIKERLYAFMPSEDGQVLITGGDNCLVVFRWVHPPPPPLSLFAPLSPFSLSSVALGALS